MLHRTKIYRYRLLLPLLLATACKQPKQRPTSNDLDGGQLDESRHATIVRTMGTQSGIVRCELSDRRGHLWFSIDGEGAYRFDGQAFTNFTTKNGLCSDRVTSIIEDRSGNILFGTNNGICKYDGQAFAPYLQRDGLAITRLFEDRSGTIWFGTRNSGVYRYDGKTLTNFLNGEDRSYNLGSRYQLILDIVQDRRGNLWFSSWNGGGAWLYDGQSFRNFIPGAEYYKSNQDKRGEARYTTSASQDDAYPQTQAHIPDDMIFSITEDRAGNLWFATRDHGVCRYDGHSFTRLWTAEGFLSRGAYEILEDRRGNLWFATDKDGVWRYDGRSFQNFTERDGLVSDSVLSILEDKDGNLWFGTKWFGLSRYDGHGFTTFSDYKNGQ